jgi:hypothetical protein
MRAALFGGHMMLDELQWQGIARPQQGIQGILAATARRGIADVDPATPHRRDVACQIVALDDDVPQTVDRPFWLRHRQQLEAVLGVESNCRLSACLQLKPKPGVGLNGLLQIDDADHYALHAGKHGCILR